MKKYTWIFKSDLDGFARLGDVFTNSRGYYGSVGDHKRFSSSSAAISDASLRGAVSISGAWILRRLPNGRGWRLVDVIEPEAD
jgi:hypothetical protein